jgi:hypothetical protein
MRYKGLAGRWKRALVLKRYMVLGRLGPPLRRLGRATLSRLKEAWCGARGGFMLGTSRGWQSASFWMKVSSSPWVDA